MFDVNLENDCKKCMLFRNILFLNLFLLNYCSIDIITFFKRFDQIMFDKNYFIRILVCMAVIMYILCQICMYVLKLFIYY